MHPIETSNIVLIVTGVALVVAGIVIDYNSIRGLLRDLREKKASGFNYYFNFAFNVVIAVAFVLAGILFVVNNLKGNPLKFGTTNQETTSESSEK